MPGVTRKGDPLDGHGCFPPHEIVGGSGDVFVNGKPVARKDDMSDHHKCGPDRHDGSMDGGGSVFANGKVMQKVGDPVTCDSTQSAGSGNVFIGG